MRRGAGGPAVQRLWLEIPLADREVPLFFPQLSGCRENYAGPTPRGGKIVWQPRTTEWMNFPARTWKAEPGPEDGVIWTPRACYQRDFAYYLWLGGAERGLAWFAENDRGYVVDPQGDTQSVRREGQKVVLRIYLVNRAGLDGPRHVVFGLQASPTQADAQGLAAERGRPDPFRALHGSRRLHVRRQVSGGLRFHDRRAGAGGPSLRARSTRRSSAARTRPAPISPR